MHDLKARRAKADALAKEGKTADAVREYMALAAAYAGSGLLLRAIGVCKRILELEPNHEETQRLLADLYGRRTTDAVAEGRATLTDDDNGDPISVPDSAVELLPPPLPPDADDDAIDVDAIAAALTPRPAGSVRPERPTDVPLFSSLSTKSFMALIDKLDAWEAEPGALVVAEGEESDSVFVVVRGSVRVEVNNIVLARLGAGSFFGEMALLSKKKRTANVIAEEKTELLEISRATLDALLEKDRSVGEALERFCRSRLIDNLARTSPLFTGIDPSVARRALTGFAARKVASGTKIVEQDGVSPGLFIVLQGALDVVAQSELGPVRLRELGPGDVVGEMSLLSRDPASATVSASIDSTVLVLPRVAFDEFVVGHPALRARLEALASERRQQNEKFLPDETSSAVLV